MPNQIELATPLEYIKVGDSPYTYTSGGVKSRTLNQLHGKGVVTVQDLVNYYGKYHYSLAEVMQTLRQVGKKGASYIGDLLSKIESVYPEIFPDSEPTATSKVAEEKRRKEHELRRLELVKVVAPPMISSFQQFGNQSYGKNIAEQCLQFADTILENIKL